MARRQRILARNLLIPSNMKRLTFIAIMCSYIAAAQQADTVSVQLAADCLLHKIQLGGGYKTATIELSTLDNAPLDVSLNLQEYASNADFLLRARAASDGEQYDLVAWHRYKLQAYACETRTHEQYTTISDELGDLAYDAHSVVTDGLYTTQVDTPSYTITVILQRDARIFPNPAPNLRSVIESSINERYSRELLQVTDVQGRNVTDLDHSPRGWYFVTFKQMQHEEPLLVTEKVLVTQ